MYAFQSAGREANPHALAALVLASERHDIVASHDIVDVRGIKLWAQGQAVSGALQHRLLERRLLRPLEVCLMAEGGITPFSLHRDLTAFVDSHHPLARCVRPFAATLLAQMEHLPLHPVVQLMLTALSASRPGTLPHAVAAMAVAGAMAARRDAPVQDVRLAMLGGLLHDIGEVYLHPGHLDYTAPLDVAGHKHLVVHPRVGQLLLGTLTDYPAVLSRAIGEHHERLDGSGYPARLVGDAVSPLGRLLAVAEVAVGICRWPDAPLTRAAFALRVVPGEFDTDGAAFVWDAARDGGEVTADSAADGDVPAQLADIDRRIDAAQRLGHELRAQGRGAEVVGIVVQALARLDGLRIAWNALGLWQPSDGDVRPAERFERLLAQVELQQRLCSVQRECLLLGDRLGEAEKVRLAPLWQGLGAPH